MALLQRRSEGSQRDLPFWGKQASLLATLRVQSHEQARSHKKPAAARGLWQLCLDEFADCSEVDQRGFRALAVVGTLDFALTGIVASLAAPLAAAGISIFGISTYDTDHILVREDRLADAKAVLAAAGHTVR